MQWEFSDNLPLELLQSYPYLLDISYLLVVSYNFGAFMKLIFLLRIGFLHRVEAIIMQCTCSLILNNSPIIFSFLSSSSIDKIIIENDFHVKKNR